MRTKIVPVHIDVTKGSFTRSDSEHESVVALCYIFKKFNALFVMSNGKN